MKGMRGEGVLKDLCRTGCSDNDLAKVDISKAPYVGLATTGINTIT